MGILGQIMEEAYYLVRGKDVDGKKQYLTVGPYGGYFHSGETGGFTRFNYKDRAIEKMNTYAFAVSVEKVTFTGTIFSKDRQSKTVEVCRK